MSAESNKQVVKQFFDCKSSGNAKGALELLAPGARWWIPTDRPGGHAMSKEEMAGGVEAFLACFKQPLTFELVSMTAEDDRVAMEQTGRGGISHGGATYGNDYHMFFRFKDGKIIEIKECMNPILAGPIMAELQAGQA